MSNQLNSFINMDVKPSQSSNAIVSRPSSHNPTQSQLFTVHQHDEKKPQAFHFLSLPSEIRNKVFSFYIGMLCIVLHNPETVRLRRLRVVALGLIGRGRGWRHFDTESYPVGILALLTTCHSIYNEFLSLLYRESTFFFEQRSHFITAFNRNSLNLAAGNTLKKGVGNLFHPFYHIRALNLNLCFTGDLGGRAGAGESRRITDSTMDIVIYNMPSIKHLQLEVNFRSRVFKDTRLLHPWFLRKLCKLPKLDYFSLAFAGITARTRSETILDAYHCIYAVNGIINWYCCGMAEEIGATGTHLSRVDSYDDLALQQWFCREIIVFLKSWKPDEHTDLLELLENDFDDLF